MPGKKRRKSRNVEAELLPEIVDPVGRIEPDTPPSPPRSHFYRLALIFAFVGLTVLIASMTIFKMSNNDIWIHLKTGELWLETLEVPDKDPYSFTASDRDYVAHEWLSGVLFYLFYAAAGVNGLIYFKSGTIFITCAALYACCRLLRIPHGIIFPSFALMLYIASARFLERPHIFSYTFIAFYLLCYFAFRRNGSRTWLYAIPVLHIFWTNLHGGHYQGIFMLLFIAAGEVCQYIRAHYLGMFVEDALPRRDLLVVAALPFACLLTAFINPYGYRLLTFPFELTDMALFMRTIYEWQSALYPSYNHSSMFLLYLPWIIILFGTFFFIRGHDQIPNRAYRDLAKAANVAVVLLWMVFSIELISIYNTPDIPSILQRQQLFWYGAVVLFLAANSHRLEFVHAGIVALFFALSLRHNRGVTDCVIATLPTLGYNLNTVLSGFKKVRRSNILESPLMIAGWGVVMLGLGLYTFQYSYSFAFSTGSRRDSGLGIANNMPTAAVDYIVTNNITGRAIPSYNAGAMLINRMYPEVKVAMDSRNDVYGEALYREYMGAMQGPPATRLYIRKHDADFFVVSYRQDRSPELHKYLKESPEWFLVYFDDKQVIYLRDRPRYAHIINRDAYKLINPVYSTWQNLKEENAYEWLVEAERAVAAAPRAWAPLMYKSKALLALRRADEAEQVLLTVLRRVPNIWTGWSDLGFVYLMKNEPEKALPAFQRCYRLNPNASHCRDYVDRIQGGEQ